MVVKNILKIIYNPIDYLKQKNKVFLIYTMGKVGSTSVYNSLKKQLPFAKVFHVHFLSDFYLNEVLPKTNHTWNIDNGRKILNYLQKNPESKSSQLLKKAIM